MSVVQDILSARPWPLSGRMSRVDAVFTRCLRWVLVLSVGLVPVAIGPDLSLAKRNMVWLIAATCVVFWGLRMLLRRDRRPRITPALTLPVLGFGAALGVSTLLAVSPFISFWGSRYRQEGLLSWFSYLVVAFLTAHELRNDRVFQRRWLIAAFAGAALNALYAFVQYAGLDPIWRYQGFLRPFGLQQNAVFLACYLALVLPIALALGFSAQSVLVRASALLLTLTLYAGLLVTGSRAGWAASWVTVTLWAWGMWPRAGRTARTWLTGSVLALVALSLVYLLPGGPFSRTFDYAVLTRVREAGGLRTLAPGEIPPDARTPTERVGMTLTLRGGGPVRWTVWRAAGRNWLRRPWFGYGLDTFRYLPNLRDPLEARIYEGRDISNFYWDRTHNQLMEIAVSAGLFGLLTYLWVIAAFLVPIMLAAIRVRDPVLSATLAGALAFLLVVQVEPASLGSSLIFWALLGFGVAQVKATALLSP